MEAQRRRRRLTCFCVVQVQFESNQSCLGFMDALCFLLCLMFINCAQHSTLYFAEELTTNSIIIYQFFVSLALAFIILLASLLLCCCGSLLLFLLNNLKIEIYWWGPIPPPPTLLTLGSNKCLCLISSKFMGNGQTSHNSPLNVHSTLFHDSWKRFCCARCCCCGHRIKSFWVQVKKKMQPAHALTPPQLPFFPMLVALEENFFMSFSFFLCEIIIRKIFQFFPRIVHDIQMWVRACVFLLLCVCVQRSPVWVTCESSQSQHISIWLCKIPIYALSAYFKFNWM